MEAFISFNKALGSLHFRNQKPAITVREEGTAPKTKPIIHQRKVRYRNYGGYI